MIITHYGISCFKVQSRETVLVFDPPSKEFPIKDFGLKLPSFQTDIVLISHNQHGDHSGYETLPGKGEDKSLFIVDGPGEYETKGIYIKGIKTFHDEFSGERHGLNTIYVLNIEDMSVCHLGDFGEKELESETKESIGETDILLMPIYGPSMDPQKAAKIVAQIEPKIIIPMHYHKDKKALKKFLDEFGNGSVKPVDKLSLKKKDLADKKTEIVVLSLCL